MKTEPNLDIVQNYAQAFSQLTPESLNKLLTLFSDNARFVDPFNDVVGKDKIHAVFTHMFTNADNPKFEIHNIAANQDIGFITWTFYMQFKNKPKIYSVLGSSQIRINDKGEIIEHIDFWNPCEGIYEKLPIIGGLFRGLRKRMSIN